MLRPGLGGRSLDGLGPGLVLLTDTCGAGNPTATSVTVAAAAYLP